MSITQRSKQLWPWVWGVCMMVVVIGSVIAPNKNPLIAHIIEQHYLVKEKSKLVTIGYYYPHFPYFAAIAAGAEEPKKELMDGYYDGKPYIFHTFYARMAALYPEIEAPHFLLGFSKYYLEGPSQLVVKEFKRATEINPYFFWAYYNLGVVYFEQKDYSKSVANLGMALSLRKEVTLKALHESVIFRQIWRNLPNPSEVAEINFAQGSQDGALLLAACYLKAGGFTQAEQLVQAIKNNPWNQNIAAKVLEMALAKQPSDPELDRLIKQRIPVRLF